MLRLRIKIDNDEQRNWLYKHFPNPDVSGVMGRTVTWDDYGNETLGKYFLVRGWAYIDDTEENKVTLAEAALRAGIFIDADGYIIDVK